MNWLKKIVLAFLMMISSQKTPKVTISTDPKIAPKDPPPPKPPKETDPVDLSPRIQAAAQHELRKKLGKGGRPRIR